MAKAVKKAGSKAPKKAPPKAMSPAVGKSDLRWQAEDDARTLMRAEEIKASRSRLAKAKSVAREQAQAAARIGKL